VWVIFAEGGGWCWTPSQCEGRARGYLGSSNGLAATFSPGGIASSVPATNPHFANATLVFLHYCDGASFASNASAQGEGGLWHRGRPNLAALFGHLAASQGLASASRVIFSGGSAGALAVYLGAVRGELGGGGG
jgi:O-palmitoleoyl-L-serine hydrolase